jgi:hypothetical protein
LESDFLKYKGRVKVNFNGLTLSLMEKDVKQLSEEHLKAIRKYDNKKIREKKQVNPKFRDDFSTKAVEQIKGLERKDIDDKVLLKYGKSTLARLMLRTSAF